MRTNLLIDMFTWYLGPWDNAGINLFRIRIRTILFDSKLYNNKIFRNTFLHLPFPFYLNQSYNQGRDR